MPFARALQVFVPAHRYLARPHRAAFPAALYLVLAAADLFFSLVAFSHGVPEGNPFMAWLLVRGMFVPGKIGVSLLVAALMVIVHGGAGRWRGVVWGGVALMGVTVAFHLWALPQFTGRPLIGIAVNKR